VLSPDVPQAVMENRTPGFSANVRLKRPDGSEFIAEAWVGIEFRYPRGSSPVCLLKNLSKDEVPIGTEVWLVDRE
jgi:hypothetical protein